MVKLSVFRSNKAKTGTVEDSMNELIPQKETIYGNGRVEPSQLLGVYESEGMMGGFWCSCVCNIKKDCLKTPLSEKLISNQKVNAVACARPTIAARGST